MKSRNRIIVVCALLLTALLTALLWKGSQGATARVVGDADDRAERGPLGPVALASKPEPAVDRAPVAASAKAVELGLSTVPRSGPIVHVATVYDGAEPRLPTVGASVELWSAEETRVFTTATDELGRVLVPESVRVRRPYVLAGRAGSPMRELWIQKLHVDTIVEIHLDHTRFAGVDVVRGGALPSPVPAFDGLGVVGFSFSFSGPGPMTLGEPFGPLAAPEAPSGRRPGLEDFDRLERRALELAGLPEDFVEPTHWGLFPSRSVSGPLQIRFEVGFPDTPRSHVTAELVELSGARAERVELTPHALETGTLEVSVAALAGEVQWSRVERVRLAVEFEDPTGDESAFYSALLTRVGPSAADPSVMKFEPIDVPVGDHRFELRVTPSCGEVVFADSVVSREGGSVRFELAAKGRIDLDGLIVHLVERHRTVELLNFNFAEQLTSSKYVWLESGRTALDRVAPGRYLVKGEGPNGQDLFIATPRPPAGLVQLAAEVEGDVASAYSKLEDALDEDAEPHLATLADALAVTAVAGRTVKLYPSGLFGGER